LAGLDPKYLDKLNGDVAIDTYSEMHGINPNIILTDEQMKPLREARTKKAQAAAMAAMAKPASDMAKGAKALGDTDGENVQDLVRTMTGT
jgi:hypothetical protein